MYFFFALGDEKIVERYEHDEVMMDCEGHNREGCNLVILSRADE